MSNPLPSGALARVPALQKLRKRAEFLFVRNGVKAVCPSLIVEARKREPPAGPPGLGLTASKKVGNAVIRNRARRRLREAARRLLPQHGRPGVDYVLVARQSTPGADWASLLDDLENALIRLAAELDQPGAPRRPKRTGKP